MTDQSDYSNNRTNILKLLEGTTFDTDVNKSLVDNTFNRLLTKDETVESIGTIGPRDPALLHDRQLKEDTVHRQTYQLQPLIHHKIATEDYTLSFKDFLNALARMGVDIDRLNEWADTERFNFAPPVDLDKIINYRDYYWYDPNGEVIQPQYIAMKSTCSIYSSRVSQRKRDIAGIGERLPVIGVNEYEREIIISNDATSIFLKDTMFDVIGSSGMDNTYYVESVRYDAGHTFIKTTEPLPNNMFNGGAVSFNSQIAILTGEMNKACGSSAGWDAGNWDDGDPVVNAGETLSPTAVVTLPYLVEFHPTTAALIAKTNPTLFTDVVVDDFGNTTYGEPTATEAKHIWEWLEYDKPEFTSAWDGEGERIDRNAWQTNNLWVHKLDLPSGAISQATRAEAPIIEYLDGLQLNEWVQVNHQWMYRDDPIRDQFQLTDAVPSWTDYNKPDFRDNWMYVGTKGSNSVGKQPPNPNATLMSTADTIINPIAKLQPHMSYLSTEFHISGKVITVPAEYSSSVGTIVVYDNTTIREYTVATGGVVVANGNTMFTVTQNVANPSKVQRVLVPNVEKHNAVLFAKGTGNKRNTALVDTNSSRVYVNDLQQMGNYLEISNVVSGYAFICGILFEETLTAEHTIDVSVDPAAESDIHKSVWNVRTTDHMDDREYISDGRPTVKVNMLEFFKHTQHKAVNEMKFPLFDLYHPDGSDAKTASPLVSYVIDPHARVNKHTGLRLKTTKNETEFHIRQHLVDDTTGGLLCYVDNSTITELNPVGLQTIWRTNIDNPYVPSIVNVDRLKDGDVYYDGTNVEHIVNVDGVNGDWEIASQWLYNPSHTIRSEINTTDLTEHTLTLLRAQPTEPGYLPSPYNFRLRDQLDYSLGGTIKEHNGSLDTLASSIFADNAAPPVVIDYAKSAYKAALASMEDYVLNNAFDVLRSTDPITISDFTSALVDGAIEYYENNENNNIVFGDTTSFVNGKGVKHWPATLPFFGLVEAHRPVIIEDANTLLIKHHDGHYNAYTFTQSDSTSIANQLTRTSYERQTGLVSFVTRKHAWTPDSAADFGSPVTNFEDIDWTRLAPGDSWVSGRTWKRFTAVDISVSPPLSDIKEGSFWLRKTDGQLMTLVGNTWTEHSSLPGDHSAAWQEVDLNWTLQQLILEVETRLFTAAIEQQNVNILPPDVYIRKNNDVQMYESLMATRFHEFVRERRILNSLGSVYRANDPFTWNYSEVAFDTVNESGQYTNIWDPHYNAVPVKWAGHWVGIYQKTYGTAYPHREPWILQNYNTKPVWWDAEYADTTGNRVWKAVMWDNVLLNRVPSEYQLPDGQESTPITVNGRSYRAMPRLYRYVPVALTRTIYDDNNRVIYNLDDLFPPFDSRLATAANIDIMGVSSVGKPIIRLTNAVQLVDRRGAYELGDMSPIEWEWRRTVDYNYDVLKTAFIMQPLRVTEALWGNKFHTVGGLRINAETNKVFRHQDTIFHGDVVDGEVYKINGLNQWYVNYNRASGLDFKVSSLRELWTKWNVSLGYQFGCFINTRSLTAATASFDLIKEDFRVISKKSRGFDTIHANSLHVSIANFGASSTRNGVRVPSGRGDDWEYIIDVPSLDETIEYYGVEHFQFVVADIDTGTFRLGNGQDVPWVTGDELSISTSKYAPYPLDPLWTYYVSVDENNPKFFKLARLKQDAMAGNGVIVRTEGTGEHYIGKVKTMFTADVEVVPHRWNHYYVDDKAIHTVTLPHIVRGTQNLIDFIDGYAARLKDNGIIANHNTAKETDPETGRLISWQTEIERCISKIYTGIGKNNSTIKQYGTTYQFAVRNAAEDPDVFVLQQHAMPYGLGEEVYIFTTGLTPAGLQMNTAYYMIPSDNDTEFKLATTVENAYSNIAINVTDQGTGELYIGAFAGANYQVDAHVEVNPFRNNIWIKTGSGIVSDLFGQQMGTSTVAVYDQYGRPMAKGAVSVLRQDKLARVTIKPNIPNDINNMANSPYDFIHLGGGKFHLDGFEHVVLFNDYAAGGYLIHDPYIGLDITRMRVSFSRSAEKTLRPSLGGYYYDNGNMIRNIEATVTDMRSFYDQLGGSATSEFIDLARALLGYDDPAYLNHINAQDKAKFMFWKGMIQQKGSKAAIAAFINSRQFVDARVDDFWAYKVADFGDSRPKYKPELRIMETDLFGPDLRYEFLQPGIPFNSTTSRYRGIDPTDQLRWVDLPRINKELDGKPMYFEADAVSLPAQVKQTGTTYYVTVTQRLDAVTIETLEGEPVEFDPVNDRTFKVYNQQLNTTLVVRGLQPAAAKLDPVEIFDVLSNTTVATTKAWDPLNNRHYHVPMREITHMADRDPVNYADTKAWTDSHVGVIWLDTSTFGYVPYDDTVVYTDFNERMARWGRLSAWSQPTAYQWVKSYHHPSVYLSKASTEETDSDIPVNARASGTPLTVMVDADGNEVDFSPIHCVMGVEAKFNELVSNPVYSGTMIQMYRNGLLEFASPIEMAEWSDVEYEEKDYVTFIMLPLGEKFTPAYKYVQVQESDEFGNSRIAYYFWSANRNVAEKGTLSAAQVAAQLAYPGVAYHVYNNLIVKPAQEAYSITTEQSTVELPDRYNQLIIRGLSEQINDGRYILRLTKDFTLRDTLNAGKSALDLKNKHSEWVLFREQQPYKVDAYLWDKMCSALIGFEIDGFDQGTRKPVPSLSRVLYDQEFGTTLRFGMEEGQAFVDREVGLTTVQTLLHMPDFETAPIDKHVFLDLYSFDTPVNIRQTLQYIFSNFSDDSVNRLFFEVMRDALAGKKDFSGIFMTSFIALHGIKVLQTPGTVI